MNYFPTSPTKGHKLAVILPYKDKESKQLNKPLVGPTSIYLQILLSQVGLPYTSCFIGYMSDRTRLAQDLGIFQPNCCLLIGQEVLSYFNPDFPSIHNFRGSIFKSRVFGYKCVATYSMGQIQTNYKWNTPALSDVNRAREESLSPSMPDRERTIIIEPTFSQLLDLIDDSLKQPKVAIDLEGYPNDVGVTCLSVAKSPSHCYIIPLRNKNDTPYWPLEQEVQLWEKLGKLLTSTSVEKIAQNAMYELFVFAWRHKVLIRNLTEDTMFQQWEIMHEQPKGLDFIGSIYTKEPYYKDERTDPDLTTHHEYCCKDSLVTIEANEEMNKALDTREESKRHYRFNISLLKPYLYMTMRGCKIDKDRVEAHREKTWELVQIQQAKIKEMTGLNLNVKSPKQLKDFLYGDLGLPPVMKRNAFTKKMEPTADASAMAKLIVTHELPILVELIKAMRLRTRFSDINKLATFPDGRIRCNLDPTGTETGRLNSKATWIESFSRLPKIACVKGEFKIQYKGEWKNLGTNLQNQTKDLRDCFVADEGYDFFQYDLSGADAWTVAADLERLGNSRMMDHLKAGIKPSVVISLLTKHGDQVYQWSIEELSQRQKSFLVECKTNPVLAHTYTCSKACQHGTNYGMMPPLMSQIQLTRALTGWVDSYNYGKTTDELELKVVHPNTMKRFQDLYTDYYGIELRNEWIRRQLSNFGYIDAASGARRYFTELRGRKNIPDAMIRTAASHEPQANTTFATNLALAKMYYDRENRTPRGSLRCESSLMIHDALAGQVHKSQRQWAQDRLESTWFNNTLIISGIEVNIPVEGGFGANWKDTD